MRRRAAADAMRRRPVDGAQRRAKPGRGDAARAARHAVTSLRQMHLSDTKVRINDETNVIRNHHVKSKRAISSLERGVLVLVIE